MGMAVGFEQVDEGIMIAQDFLTRLVLLAADEAAPPPADAPAGSPLTSMLLFFVPIGILFWLLLWRPQKAEQARRMAMLREVKPNDHVVTAGGIHGVVTNVHREADIVTIKVDEGSNTKLRVSLGAIARVMTEEPPAESPPGK
jgi:preprotein translocase subunit YajC